MFGEDGANWYFDRIEKDTETAMCSLYSSAILSSCWVTTLLLSGQLGLSVSISYLYVNYKLSVRMRNCLGHKVVPNFPSLASSFLFSMSYTECLKDKMFPGQGKLDIPIEGKRQQSLCGRTTMSRDGGWRKSTPGRRPRNISIVSESPPWGPGFTLPRIQLATKV